MPVAPALPVSSDPAPEPDDSSRALEQALVQRGGLLLPAWTVEVEPEFRYTYFGSNELRIVDQDGVPSIAQRDLRRDTFEGRLNARVGLPWTMQADIKIPYIHARERTVITGVRNEDTESGIGDVEVGLTKELFAERNGIPSFLGSIRYKAATGDYTGTSISPGSGTNAIQGALTVVKRLDPLVLFGNLSYLHHLDTAKAAGQRIRPGDSVGLKVGTVLAASPETSITLAVDTSFLQETEINGVPVRGSDVVSSVFEFGIGTVLTAQTQLSLTAGIGITEAAPDLRLGFSLPTRF